MLKIYPKILHSYPEQVAESRHDYQLLTERHLQILWMEQKHIKKISTSQGELIEVLSPGIWNREAGPDFLRAHLRIGQREYRGDVEIHLNEQSMVSTWPPL